MDREEKIRHIQKIAFNLFLDNGYEATTIRKICIKAKVEAPSIYNFFGSKKGLFLSVVSSLWEKYTEESNCYFSNTLGGSPDKKLFAYFNFSVRYTIENLDEARFFLRFSLFPPSELKKDILHFLSQQQTYKLNQISSIVADCVQKGLIIISPDQAIASFIKYVNNNTFDIVFTHWAPSEKELLESWESFFTQLNGHRKIEL